MIFLIIYIKNQKKNISIKMKKKYKIINKNQFKKIKLMIDNMTVIKLLKM